MAKKNPEAYEGDVADTCYNLALLHQTNNQKKESKQYFETALALYEKYPHYAVNVEKVRTILAENSLDQ